MSDESKEDFDTRLKASAGAAGVDIEADEIAQLEQQLAAAQDTRAEAESQRARGRRVIALKDQIAEEARKAKEEGVLAALEAKHGLVGKAIAPVYTLDGMLVVQKPDGVKLRNWQDKFGATATSDQVRQLVRPCVVYPDLSVFDSMATERPIIVVDAATEVLKLGGLRLKELGGK